MKILYPCHFLVFLLFVSNLYAQDGQLEPQKASEDELAVIQRGADLHDKGKYDEAIEQFSKVLVKNSACVQAMYEMANTYYTKGDRKKAFEYSEMGLKYKSQYSALFYVLEGGIEDDNNNPPKAIEDYKNAISVAPKFQSAYFNLAITLRRLNRNEEALNNFKQSLFLKPWHVSSNYHIAKIFMMKNQKYPAFMADMFFLRFANDDDKRIPDVLKEARQLTEGSRKNSSGATTITLNTDTTEGDFMPAELLTGLISPSQIVDSFMSKKPTPLEKELHIYEDAIKAISICVSDASANSSKFSMKFYGTFFHEMEKSGNAPAFCRIIGSRIDQKESDEWLKANPDAVKKYYEWEKQYFAK